MKKYIPIILIILGLLIISIPSITNYKIKTISQFELVEIDNIQVNKPTGNINLNYDFDAVEDIDPKNLIGLNIHNLESHIIGFIFIPKINMSLPILEGTTSENLFAGATTMRPDQKVGRGNYPLAGHYMKDPNLLFGGLMDIRKDDLIYITDKKNIYIYKVEENLLVEDTRTDLIEDSLTSQYDDAPIISLMTCYYSSSTGKRFFSIGKLLDIEPYSSDYIHALYPQ